jgi:hypothetical protein
MATESTTATMMATTMGSVPLPQLGDPLSADEQMGLQ